MRIYSLLLASLPITMLLATATSLNASDEAAEKKADDSRRAKIAERQGWLENYKKGKDILQKIAGLSAKERKKLDIAAYRGERIALVAGGAPPGGTNDLVTEQGFYLRVVNKAGKDLRPHCAWWEVFICGEVLQVFPANKVIVIEVAEKDWLVLQTG